MPFQKGNQLYKLRTLPPKPTGENSPYWKGDDVGYAGVHKWARANKPKPAYCEECQVKPPLDLSNISGKYKRDINDFDWLCRSCHKKRDITAETRAKYSANAKKASRNERGIFTSSA